MNARSYPRTLTQAFGPYASGPVHPMRDDRPFDWQDKVVLGASIIAAVGVALIMLLGAV